MFEQHTTMFTYNVYNFVHANRPNAIAAGIELRRPRVLLDLPRCWPRPPDAAEESATTTFSFLSAIATLVSAIMPSWQLARLRRADFAPRGSGATGTYSDRVAPSPTVDPGVADLGLGGVRRCAASTLSSALFKLSPAVVILPLA